MAGSKLVHRVIFIAFRCQENVMENTWLNVDWKDTYRTEKDIELACKLGEAGKLRNFSL